MVGRRVATANGRLNDQSPTRDWRPGLPFVRGSCVRRSTTATGRASAPVTISLDEHETPFLFTDLDRMENNITRMADAARHLGVVLRPHAKTHKIPEIGCLQVAAGATGIAVVKLSEAEVFAEGGVEDIFVAYQVVEATKADRLARHAARVKLRCAVESELGARTLSEAARMARVDLEVVLEIDLGIGRTGVPAGLAAVALARRIAELPGLRLVGIFGFRGFSSHASEQAGREEWGREEGELLVAAADELRSAGFHVAVVSAGSTPTALPAARVRGVTEIRPGQYLFGCANSVSQGAIAAEDVALFARATVIGRPREDHAVIDAGSKTIGTDGPWRAGLGFGYVEGAPSTRLIRVWEEHGVLNLDETTRHVKVGDRVSIVPNHVCTAVNLHDQLLGVRGDDVEVAWRVAARGRVT